MTDTYLVRLAAQLVLIDQKAVGAIAAHLWYNPGRLFVAGNGGSAAIASHFVVDMMKTASAPCRATCLSDNVPLLTALSNDHSYGEALWRAAAMHGLGDPNTHDTLLLVSSSGTSPNVVALADRAEALNVTLITLTGKTGGPLMELADINVHVDSDDYGIIEDCHHAVMHSITDDLKRYYGGINR